MQFLEAADLALKLFESGLCLLHIDIRPATSRSNHRIQCKVDTRGSDKVAGERRLAEAGEELVELIAKLFGKDVVRSIWAFLELWTDVPKNPVLPLVKLLWCQRTGQLDGRANALLVQHVENRIRVHQRLRGHVPTLGSIRHNAMSTYFLAKSGF